MSEHSVELPRSESPTLARRLVRWWKALRFSDVVLLTLLPLAAVVLLFATSVYDYARARQFDDWWSTAQGVPGYFNARIDALRRLPATLSLRQQFDQVRAEPRIIRFTVAGGEWDAMQGDPLAMWGQWVDARLEYGSTSIDARIRKRGDNSLHWLTDKRSLTVRTPRDDFYKRFRSFGLSGKDVVPSYLANRLATEFGVLAPATEVVAVYLNNRFYGTYRFVELADESFLRPYGRMPGNIFRADRAERGEIYKGVPRDVFLNPTLWDRTATNDRWTSAGPDQLRLLLEDINGTTFADHLRLLRRVDTADIARLLAYLLVVGDPYHMDQFHNQLLYEDPSTQRLHPIPWDIRLLDLATERLPVNELFEAMLRDPFVADATIREIAARVSNDDVIDLADSLLRDVEGRLGPYLEYDRGRAGLIPDVGSADASMAILRGNVAQLRRWLDNDTVAFHAGRAGTLVLADFETRGRVGADLVAFELPGQLESRSSVRLDSNRNGVLDADDPALPVRVDRGADGTRLTMQSPVALLAGWTAKGGGVRPGHLPYRIFLDGIPAGQTPVPVITNRITGAAAALVPWGARETIRPATGWHPWQYPRPRGRTVRLAGTVILDSTLMLGATDTLRIAPGTTLLLGADVSIISRGLVVAEGTASQPIRVLPQRPGQPWGAFSLQEHGTDGSRVRFVEFVQGGGALVDRIEYIGMVNVHHATDVVFDHITFRENLRSDDTFHALHSRVDLTNSSFIRANSDAVDYDVSSGEIRGNTFDGSGGDALDLMTSDPRVIGNTVRGAGDKGISIGEASRPFVFDNHIEGCAIGIEVKDRSEPLVMHNDIVSNGVGLRERRKNWRYGGGAWPTIINTAFRDNGTLRDRDTLSRLTAHGVVGLGDSTVESPVPVDWLYRAAGVTVQADGPGRPRAWQPVPPVAPLVLLRFDDDFGARSDGWAAGGGATRLEKRRDALRLHVEGRPGSASRTIDWTLTGGGTLVIETSNRDLARARVTVYTADDSVSRPLRIGGDLSTFSLTVIALPPGRYRGVRLEAEPREGLSHAQAPDGLFVVRAGRLELRSLAVYDANDQPPHAGQERAP